MSSENDKDEAAAATRGEMRMITRAASLMRAMAERPDGSSLGQLAKDTGLARSTVQRIVYALEAERFVSSDGAGALRLGGEVARLGASVHRNVTGLLRRHLERLHASTGDTVDLTLLQGDAAVVIEQVASARTLRVVSQIGTALPLHCTASGKAHLSQLGRAAGLALLGRSLASYTPHSITDPERVIDGVLDDHQRVSVDQEEFAVGVCAVAVPITGFSENYAAAVSMPKLYFKDQFQTTCAALQKFGVDVARITGMR